MSRGSASAQTMEAEPPDMRYQALPGNEYNHLGLLYQFKKVLVESSILYQLLKIAEPRAGLKACRFPTEAPVESI